MKEFIEYIVTSIVKNPDQVVVEENVEGTIVRIVITVAQEDMGLIIGREGKTIKNIRSLARAKAIKDQVKIYVDLNDPYADDKPLEDEPTEENEPQTED